MAACDLAGLSAYLREGAARPFVWGECDCCLWICDWVFARRGVDPAFGLRGEYCTASGAQRRINAAGGLVALARQRFKDAGLVETWNPAIGDVAVVENLSGEALALTTPIGFAAKSLKGIITGHFPMLAAWTV